MLLFTRILRILFYDMKPVVSFLITGTAILIVGCCTTESPKKAEAPLLDSATTVVPAKPTQPTAIAQNVSRVKAVVEEVTVVDNTQFSVRIFILTSEPVSGKYSLIEPEQRVTVYPEFRYADAGGDIDKDEPRNKKLLALREAQVGQSFMGKITIDKRGIWKLVEVED